MPRKKSDTLTPATLTAVPKRRATKARKEDNTTASLLPQAPTYDEIAHAAYMRFLNRGAGHGSDFNDWLEAERELTAARTFAKAG